MPSIEDGLRAERQRVLDIIAEGGSRAKAEYDAQSAAFAAQKTTAIQKALADQYRSEPLQAQNKGILDARYSQAQDAQARHQAATQTYLNSLQAGMLGYSDMNRDKVFPLAQFYRGLDEAGGGGRGGGGGGYGGGGGGGGEGDEPYWWNWFYENELNQPYGSYGKGGGSKFAADIRERAQQPFQTAGGRTLTRQNTPGWKRARTLMAYETPLMREDAAKWGRGQFKAPKGFTRMNAELQAGIRRGDNPRYIRKWIDEGVKKGKIGPAGGKLLKRRLKAALKNQGGGSGRGSAPRSSRR